MIGSYMNEARSRNSATIISEDEQKSKSFFSVIVFIFCYLVTMMLVTNLFAEVFDKQSRNSVALAYSVISIIFYLSFYSINKKRLKKYNVSVQDELEEYKVHIQNVQLQKRQEQLNALQSQINPHFLYNTLDTIRGFAIEKDAKEIADIVAALSSMFKYSMDYSSPLVTVNDELSYLERYLKIQSMRFPGKFTYEQIHDCKQETLYKVMIPKLTLQPLVENAISHGFNDRVSGGRITIRYIESKTSLQIIVSDNGKGMSEDMVLSFNKMFYKKHSQGEVENTSHGGIALPNIDLRIKLYCGDKYGLFIASTPGLGTDVTMTVPIDSDMALADLEMDL